ncbi:response regulator transcription factor [Micromonospora sp. PLK6-60]|uniref:response regulator transcription factor n=1 Tax=Micromonospora sp. PLK6-60 TaxID=2873383 RepID=UPI001CA632B1|nr:response regulator transcription factor [Micromonospora sp. PLK6-60]MBY8873687.1 response regulator transcription factor [Micromonospora sp. PLK6-60]
MSRLFAVHARPATHLVVEHAVGTLPGVVLAGHSASAAEAVRVVQSLAPDALTVDVRLPDGDGIDLAAELLAARPSLRVVLFGPATDGRLRRAVLAGIAGHLPGPAGGAGDRPGVTEVDRVAGAIRDVLAGRVAFGSRFLTGALRAGTPTGLSGREREVTELLGAGLPATEIARRLRLTESTVRTYAARARAKREPGGT